jgi:hypothetical protein
VHGHAFARSAFSAPSPAPQPQVTPVFSHITDHNANSRTSRPSIPTQASRFTCPLPDKPVPATANRTNITADPVDQSYHHDTGFQRNLHVIPHHHNPHNGRISPQRGARARHQPPCRNQSPTQQPSKRLPPIPPTTHANSLSPQVISNIRNLTASLFGVAAGTLGLESYPGFIFYLLGTLVVSLLLFALKTEGKPEKYFYKPLGDMWMGEVFGGLSGFVLTWTLFYGLVRA